VVGVALSIELAVGGEAGDAATLLVLVRVWRIVRITHGFAESGNVCGGLACCGGRGRGGYEEVARAASPVPETV